MIQCAATGNSQNVVPFYSMFEILQMQPLPENSGDGVTVPLIQHCPIRQNRLNFDIFKYIITSDNPVWYV